MITSSVDRRRHRLLGNCETEKQLKKQSTISLVLVDVTVGKKTILFRT
jgi:hypothetical protein